jgi:tetratricopeptide (TPR) repeat protein
MAARNDTTGPAEALRTFASLELSAVVGRRPEDVGAFLDVGRERLRAGDAEAACDLVEYACLLRADDAASWALAAVARLGAGRTAPAGLAAEAAWTLEPSWQRAALRALCCEAAGDEAGAERWREEALASVPESGEERVRLERALAREREVER